jgi:hypothetical protein
MGFVKNTIGAITGSTAAKAAKEGSQAQQAATSEAIAAREAAAERGQEFLDPFGAPGQLGLEQASFLTDPQQQFEFLQSNPLFGLQLENLNQQTGKLAAARGRLSAGDTLEQFGRNALLAASPLIGEQKRSIAGLLDFGRGVAGQQANVEIGTGSQVAPLLQDIGNIQAGGAIGAANARAAGVGNLINIGSTIAGAGGFGGGGGTTAGLTSPARFLSPGAPGSVGFGGGVGL